MLRALREPGTGRPSPLARVLALLVVLGLVAISAPPVLSLVGWLFSLL